MRTMLRITALTTSTLLLVAALALPASATEATEKWGVFTRSPHSAVGGIILLAGAVLVGAAIANAVQQLRGKRGQADGKFRWR